MKNPEDLLNDVFSNLNKQQEPAITDILRGNYSDGVLHENCVQICNGLLSRQQLNEQQVKLLSILLKYLAEKS